MGVKVNFYLVGGLSQKRAGEGNHHFWLCQKGRFPGGNSYKHPIRGGRKATPFYWRQDAA